MANNHRAPTFTEEETLQKEGYRLVAGVDEVGRGALVGPVFAAAIIIPTNLQMYWNDEVRDSKRLSPAKREFLHDRLRETAVSVGIGFSPSEVIDTLGIAKATRLAMASAIGQLRPQPQYLLIDYLRLPEVKLPQKSIKFGDSLCFSIACASIVAKVARDRLMVELDKDYPGYGFAEHKGYGTREHLNRLHHHGPCPLHRRSFRPVKEILEKF
jgi:ribonuclease HII